MSLRNPKNIAINKKFTTSTETFIQVANKKPDRIALIICNNGLNSVEICLCCSNDTINNTGFIIAAGKTFPIPMPYFCEVSARAITSDNIITICEY